jgi:hypothetical protein
MIAATPTHAPTLTPMITGVEIPFGFTPPLFRVGGFSSLEVAVALYVTV